MKDPNIVNIFENCINATKFIVASTSEDELSSKLSYKPYNHVFALLKHNNFQNLPI